MTSAVSISEAARLTGKNRRTLHRHIEAGRLSVTHDATGAPQLEIVELLRVYGPLKNAPAPQPHGDAGATSEAVPQQTTPPATSDDALELVRLRAEVDKLQALLEAKDHHIERLDRALLAIEYSNKATATTEAKETPQEPRPGFLRRLFGG